MSRSGRNRRRPSRVSVHAALGDAVRLKIVDELTVSDRSVSDLGDRTGAASNLLAHHLEVLEAAGIIGRTESHGDRRRRYVHLRAGTLAECGIRLPAPPAQPAVFICTHNSARSQLAAALWRSRTGCRSSSGGTHPAPEVDPRAIDAGRRVGLDISTSRPRSIPQRLLDTALVVTVCDRAREELTPAPEWLHWSVADPLDGGRVADFDRVVHELEQRIEPFVAAGAHATTEGIDRDR